MSDVIAPVSCADHGETVRRRVTQVERLLRKGLSHRQVALRAGLAVAAVQVVADRTGGGWKAKCQDLQTEYDLLREELRRVRQALIYTEAERNALELRLAKGGVA